MVHLGQVEHHLALTRRSVMVHSERSITLLLASFDVALPIEREKIKLNRLNYRDYPLHALIFAWLVLRVQVTFSSEPSCNLLGATILNIMSTNCAYVLSLLRARSQQQHAALPQVPQH